MRTRGEGMWWEWVNWMCEVSPGHNMILWGSESWFGLEVIDLDDLIS